MFAGVGYLFVAREQQRKIIHHEDTLQQGHGVLVQILPHLVAYKEQLRLRVVYDVMYIIRLELMQDRHNHRTIGDGSQEGHSPMRAVTSANRNFVAFLYATTLKDDMQLLYLSSHILVLQRGTLIVS